MSDKWHARIIDFSNNSTVWNNDYFTTCVPTLDPSIQKFEYLITDSKNPLVISEVGDYQFQIEIGETFLTQNFFDRNKVIY